MSRALPIVLVLLSSSAALADAKGVGLGVAGGFSYSPTKLEDGSAEPVGSAVAWGFFVDIPLIETFFISPAAMLYELDLGDGNKPVTDVDLNFKFIVPIGRMRLGAGVLAGLTNAEQKYAGHYGVLGYASYNLVGNLDAFVLAQWKRLEREGANVTAAHGYVGGMFRF